MKKLIVTIDILEPIVLSGTNGDALLTSSQDYFSGTQIRGALAGLYIKNRQLGETAQTDAEFCKLFLRDNVKYTAAYPLYNGERSMILPLSLQKNKLDGKICDLLFAKPKPGFKGLKGCGCIKNEKIYMVSAAKNISLHMDRSSDNERISGKSEDGNLYNYESLSAGQSFAGEILGTEEELSKLEAGLKLAENDIIYFGRSKYTQYGKCRISFGKLLDAASAKAKAAEICLYCETPFIAEGGVSQAEMAFQECVDFMNEATDSNAFSLVAGSVIASTMQVENFVGIWGMRRPNEQAISAGSVFKLKNAGSWDEKSLQALTELMYGGCGLRSNEGFGQFRLWQEQTLTVADKQKTQKTMKPTAVSGEVKAMVWQIIRRRMNEKIRAMAYDDAESVKSRLKGKTHLFSRLEDMLGDRLSINGKRQRFFEKVQSEIRDKSTAQKHLQSIKFGSSDLLEMLSGEAAMPYAAGLDWNTLLGNNISKLAKEISISLPDKNDDEVFYEYCLWFFRHARKQAGNKADKEVSADA